MTWPRKLLTWPERVPYGDGMPWNFRLRNPNRSWDLRGGGGIRPPPPRRVRLRPPPRHVLKVYLGMAGECMSSMLNVSLMGWQKRCGWMTPSILNFKGILSIPPKKIKTGYISVIFFRRKLKQTRKYFQKNARTKKMLKRNNGSHFRSKFMSCHQVAFDLVKSSVL